MHRSSMGTSIAEVPVNLWVFLFILLFPFIDFVTFGYRAALAYYCVRDATTKAALADTFTDAKSSADAALSGDSGNFTGISFSGTLIQIVQVDQSGTQTPGTAVSPGASGGQWNPSNLDTSDVYLIRLTTNASVTPLINLGNAGNWGSVPGITAPLMLPFCYQVTVENVQGLTS